MKVVRFRVPLRISPAAAACNIARPIVFPSFLDLPLAREKEDNGSRTTFSGQLHVPDACSLFPYPACP